MSILCKVSGIPVFYDIKDAKSFGATYGLTNVHTHTHDGRTGYMPGSNHNHAITVIKNVRNTEVEDTLLKNWSDDVTSAQLPQSQQDLDIGEENESITLSPPLTLNRPETSPGGGY